MVELVRRAGPQIGSLVLPKVERAEDVAAVERLLDELGGEPSGVRLQVLIETAAGLLRVGEIAAASSRLEALILGYADLAASLGRAPGVSAPESWLYAQETLLVAARAFGLQAIDGPYLEIRDDGGLQRRAGHVRALGFDGKWAVHPDSSRSLTLRLRPRLRSSPERAAILDALRARRGARRSRASRRDDR